MDSLLITDYDGTITDLDFYEVVYPDLVEPGTPNYWIDYTEGRITHFEAMRKLFAAIRCDEARLYRAIWETRPDPNFGAAVADLNAAGWDVAIVSAGCDWYIIRMLEKTGVRVTVHANPCHFVAGEGLRAELPLHSRFLCPSTGIDKEAVVREAQARYRRVAFAGNGPPDLASAYLVPEELRFARGWLADTLTNQGVGFTRFEPWSEIADILKRI